MKSAAILFGTAGAVLILPYNILGLSLSIAATGIASEGAK
jgi:hypothetical protein